MVAVAVLCEDILFGAGIQTPVVALVLNFALVVVFALLGNPLDLQWNSASAIVFRSVCRF